MSDADKLFEVFACCIGPTPLPYVCRIYMALSILLLSVLPSDSRTEIIQTAVNDRFISHFSVDQIRTLTNLIAMIISFVRNVFLMEDFTHNNVLMNIKHIVSDVLHDLNLLSFAIICIYWRAKLPHWTLLTTPVTIFRFSCTLDAVYRLLLTHI
jgi:hypothetical protein